MMMMIIEHYLSSPNMAAYHAATQITPLKFRTNSVSSSGKIFQTENVNQELLAELEDATLEEEDLLISKPPHYILHQCHSISKLLLKVKGLVLKITSLTLINKSLYHKNCWSPLVVPHFLRFTGPSQPQQGPKTSRHTTISRLIPTTSVSKSSHKTGKKLGPDWDWTAQD